MAAEDAAGSGDSSEGDKEADLRACEEDAAVAACEAPSPADGPPAEAKEAKDWKWAVMILCFYGFMGSIKPGEPFITPYLLSAEKNFTREQVSGGGWGGSSCRLRPVWAR